MIKRVKRVIGILVGVLLLISSPLALAGDLFSVSSGGTASDVSITLCSNGNGPLSCQNYNVTGLTLDILATVNHSYPAAGIKINTPGYNVAVDGGCTPISNGYCLFAVNGTVDQVITLTGPIQTVVATAGNGGSISPNGTTTVLTGGSIGFTATPNTGYRPFQWFVDGALVKARGSHYTLHNITANHTVNVTFTDTYKIFYAGGSNGNVYTSGDGGAAWALLNKPGGDNGGINSLFETVIDSVSIIFVGTQNGNIYSSADGGVTWTELSPLENGSVNALFYYDNILYAGTAGNGGDGIVWISSDNGRTWVSDGSYPSSVSAIYVNDTGLYVGSGDIIYLNGEVSITSADLSSVTGLYFAPSASPSPTIYYGTADENVFINHETTAFKTGIYRFFLSTYYSTGISSSSSGLDLGNVYNFSSDDLLGNVGASTAINSLFVTSGD